jgi:hypothetical protein
MATFKDLLNRRHGYLSSDFATDGEVVIDSERGTVAPLGVDGKTVALSDIFKAGQSVGFGDRSDAADRPRFVVTDVNHDGLNVVSAAGAQGFLPWESIASSLRRSQQVHIESLHEMEDVDEQDRAMRRVEITRITELIRHHRAIAYELGARLHRLERIGDRPSLSHPPPRTEESDACTDR